MDEGGEEEEEMSEPLEGLNTDFLVHGLLALAKEATPKLHQSKWKTELLQMLGAYGPPQHESFEKLRRQLRSWRVDNLKDLERPTQKKMIVDLSNWLGKVNSDVYEQPLRCFIELSGIPDSGYGLKAARRLPISEEDRYIAQYGGIYYASEEEFRKQTGKTIEESTSNYIIQTKYGILDGETGFHLDEPGRWANTQRTKAECNAVFKWTKNKKREMWLWVMKGKVIEQGHEIFVWYSEEFAEMLYPKRQRFGQADLERALCNMCISAPADRVCGACESSAYCSESCATAHWERGGHCDECK